MFHEKNNQYSWKRQDIGRPHLSCLFCHKPFPRDDQGPYLRGNKNVFLIDLLFLERSMLLNIIPDKVKELPSRHTERQGHLNLFLEQSALKIQQLGNM